jgi:peroxiredoxin
LNRQQQDKKSFMRRLFGLGKSKQITTYARSALQPGASAVDFTLPSTQGDSLSLGDLIEKPIILAFYPADWSPVCGDQLALYNDVLPMFEDYDARLVGISVDSIWSHHAYAEVRGLNFPLLADFEPKGAVARAYGVYDARKGVCKRALFVLDGEGIIRWSHVSPSNVNPGADGILVALEALGSP